MIRTLKLTPDAGPGNGLAPGPRRRLLAPHRGLRRPELSGADHVRALPQLPGVHRRRAELLRPAGPRGLSRGVVDLADRLRLRGPGRLCDTKGDGDEDDAIAQREGVSVLIFRLGAESLAFRTRAVAEVTTPRPVHRVPHRSGRILAGLVNLQGQAQLCVSLHGLLGIDVPGPPPRLVVLRDRRRGRDLGLRRRRGRGRPARAARPVGRRPFDPGQPGRRVQPGGPLVERAQRRPARRSAGLRGLARNRRLRYAKNAAGRSSL